MTTLPTHDDGGIDWDNIIETSAGVAWHVRRGEMVNMPAVKFSKLVAEHTRERCAKVADASPYDCTMADKIRKIEV